MVWALLVSLAGTAAAFAVARRRCWVLVTVEGTSMLPVLRPGERVLVRRTSAGAIRTGQVVVAENPDAGVWRTPPLPAGGRPDSDRHWIVKRAVAGPGDPMPPEVLDALGDQVPRRVPPGHFVLLGDNRRHSVDSRVFGPVPGERILGTVGRVPGPGRPDDPEPG